MTSPTREQASVAQQYGHSLKGQGVLPILVERVGFESARNMEAKEFCGAPSPSKY